MAPGIHVVQGGSRVLCCGLILNWVSRLKCVVITLILSKSKEVMIKAREPIVLIEKGGSSKPPKCPVYFPEIFIRSIFHEVYCHRGYSLDRLLQVLICPLVLLRKFPLWTVYDVLFYNKLDLGSFCQSNLFSIKKLIRLRIHREKIDLTSSCDECPF